MVIAAGDLEFALKLEKPASAEVLEDGVVNLSLAFAVLVHLKVLHRIEVLEHHGALELHQVVCIHGLSVNGDLVSALKPSGGG